MEKVAIYCRLSDEDINKKNTYDESESIQNQKNMLVKYAVEQGWDIYKIYSDDDYSGLDADRPDFNLMIEDARSGKFNIVLCKTQSRFTRDMELVEKYLHKKFIEWGIRFVSIVDRVDTSDKYNKKSRQINGLINEWYCEDISESVKSVLRLKQEQGKFIGSFAAYGYKKDITDKNKLIIDDEAAQVVRMIFSMYNQGNGLVSISRKLNQLGIPCPTRYKQLNGMNYINPFVQGTFGLWSISTVKRILKNEIYIGNMVQGKFQKISYKSKKIINLKKDDWIIVEGTHEPIIDLKTFNEVQRKMELNTRSGSNGKVHIFAGKVRCMDCGNTMNKSHNGSKYKGSSTIHYLKCKMYTYSLSCTSHTIRLDELENIIVKKVREHVNSLSEMDIINDLADDDIINHKRKIINDELKKVSKQIDERIYAFKNIYIDKVKKIIHEEDYLKFQKMLIDEKKQLMKHKKFLDQELKDLSNKHSDREKYLNLIKKYKDFKELSVIMVNELIDHIEIGEKNKETCEQKVRIYWSF